MTTSNTQRLEQLKTNLRSAQSMLDMMEKSCTENELE